VDFGPVRLLGYNLSKLGFEHLPEEPLRPGDTLHLTLFWQAVGRMQTDFTLALEFQDQAGHVVVSREVKPTGGAHTPTHWGNGEVVRDQQTLLLPADLPPSTYGMLLQVANLPTTERPLLLEWLSVLD
jgi:hypothetical protein